MPRLLIADFNTVIRDWDGFGFNYVQTAQTRDFVADPQEYGAFSTSPIEKYADRGFIDLSYRTPNINLSARSVTIFFELPG